MDNSTYIVLSDYGKFRKNDIVILDHSQSGIMPGMVWAMDADEYDYWIESFDTGVKRGGAGILSFSMVPDSYVKLYKTSNYSGNSKYNTMENTTFGLEGFGANSVSQYSSYSKKDAENDCDEERIEVLEDWGDDWTNKQYKQCVKNNLEANRDEDAKWWEKAYEFGEDHGIIEMGLNKLGFGSDTKKPKDDVDDETPKEEPTSVWVWVGVGVAVIALGTGIYFLAKGSSAPAQVATA